MKANLKRTLSNGLYTPRDKRGWIKVWQLFALILDKSGADIEIFVACRNCYHMHKFQMSTSSLMKHKCAMQLDVPNHNSEWKTDIPFD
ncbi:GD19508 [Drosophila simulans]|uniref:GD19508 n=1 Tax=Drosophila simulans TaxID=7240 RepID=B4QYZ9_DROSI|nr:GD19508 [Drosophila simulans]